MPAWVLFKHMSKRSMVFKFLQRSPKPKKKSRNELHDYVVMLFKLLIIHKNLDTAVDMGDGERSVRSAK